MWLLIDSIFTILNRIIKKKVIPFLNKIILILVYKLNYIILKLKNFITRVFNLFFLN